MTVGERMKHRRKEIGMSAEQVAEKLGISPSTVYRYENGEIEKMGIDKLAPIADAIQTTPAYLMGWNNDFSEPTEKEIDAVDKVPTGMTAIYSANRPKLLAKFADRLKTLRTTKQLSQQDLATQLGCVSKSSINMYERGEREPGLDVLGAIADFFNVDLDYLIGKSESPSRYSSLIHDISQDQTTIPFTQADGTNEETRRKTIAERLKSALEARNMNQSDLSRSTGIGKSSISTYLTGEYEPKQKNIYKMALALNVNEAWLMGADVPMERKDATSEQTENPISANTIPPYSKSGILYHSASNELLNSSSVQKVKHEFNCVVTAKVTCEDKMGDVIADIFNIIIDLQEQNRLDALRSMWDIGIRLSDLNEEGLLELYKQTKLLVASKLYQYKDKDK